MNKILIPFALGTFLLAGCTAIPPEGAQSSAALNGKIHGHADTSQGEIAPAALYQKILNKEKIVLLDVREESEYEEAHIPGTTNRISVKELSAEKLEEAGITKNDQIVVYCRSGNRSRIAAKLLRELGYQNVLDLNSGIIHWMEDEFPVESGKSATAGSGGDSQQVSGQAVLMFDRPSHDFGEIPQFGGNVETTFAIHNMGTAPLEIGTITTSCACTEARIAETTIQPGSETTLTVVFNPNLHEEPIDTFKRTIFIPTNDPQTPEAELTIEVDILEGK